MTLLKNVNCVVPENIHTYITGGITGNSAGVGGQQSKTQEILEERGWTVHLVSRVGLFKARLS